MDTPDSATLAAEFKTATGLEPPAPDAPDDDPAKQQWDLWLPGRISAMIGEAAKAASPTNPFILVEGCRYGRFLVPPTDMYVGRALQRYKEYSQLELDLLLQFITPQTRVVIVGANIGSLVVPIAQAAGEVVAFEPQRWVFQLCCANAVLNGLVNVRAYWGACGPRPSVLKCPVLRPDQVNNFGALELPNVQAFGGDLVPVYALDKLPEMDMGLLTIDVEGMELDVLQGSEQTVARCRPVIFFEADRVLKRGDVFAWLRQRNYDLHWYRTPLFNPENFAGDPVNEYVSPNGGVIVAENVIATPRERAFTLNGFLPVLE